MARRAEAAPIYAAAAEWWDRCLVLDGSVFLPERRLWSLENLRALRAAFGGNPQLGSDTFDVKFQRQIGEQPPEVIQLAAEMLWVLFLFPRKLLSSERKRELVTRVWGWSGAPLDPEHPYLREPVLAGIGSAGTAYNTQRDRELEGLIEVAIDLRGSPPGWVTSPWDLALEVDRVPKAARRNIRNILLHLVFPEQFERVASLSRKRDIVGAFSSLLDDYEPSTPGQPVEIDRQLLHIRGKLEAESPGRAIDFYDPELRAVWDPPKQPGPERPELNDFAWFGVSFAYWLASRASPPRREPDTTLLFAAYLLLSPSPLHHSRTGRALFDLLTSTRKSKDLYFLLADYGFQGIPTPPPQLPQPSVGPFVTEVLVAAEGVRRAVTIVRSVVSARHVLAALLRPGADYPVQDTLQAHGYILSAIRSALLDTVQVNVAIESPEAWRQLLDLDEAPPPAPSPSIYAGFSTDALAMGAERGVSRADDRLGVMRDVTALCEVLAARETRPPLAVGLFGDWGTGKSFFMELMRREIEELGARNPAFYCSRVVQVWFNAWHYMDSDLWASLAARVFEELAEQPKRWEPREDVRKQLFAKLEESRGVLAEAVEERKDAQARVEALRAQHARARHSLAGTVQAAASAAMAGLADDEEIQARLGEVREQLGLSAARMEIGRVEEQAREMRTLGARAMVLARALVRAPVRTVVGVLVFVGVTFGAVRLLDSATGLDTLARVVAGMTAGVAAFSTAVAPVLRKVSRAVGWLEEVSTRIRQQRDAAERKAEAALELEMTALEKREREAQAVVDELTREIEEMRAGRRLQRFILERHASAEYRQRLGIVNLIRNDFEHLSRLLAESADERRQTSGTAADPAAPPLPQVDRIVLYIDDLDRCPEDRVVDVLQAVHLLLAFPLFVVVVGVDSRWLLLSLQDHYAALRGRGGERRADGGKTEAEWSTTPQNYLEKIFQIPFTLRPMEPDGFGSLVEALLPVGDGAETETQTVAVRAGEAGPEQPDEEEAEDDDGEEEDGGEPADRPAPPESIPPPLPPNPQGLTVEAWEREFIRGLHPLIASPRALKRFTNVYRFLRVQQRGADLDRFRGAEARPGEFQVVGLLLAALVGYPREATHLLHRVLTERDRGWWELVEALDEARAEERDARDADPDGRRGRPSLREALLAVKPAVAEHPREAYTRWTREVARFSFQSGRILSVPDRRDPAADAAAAPESTPAPSPTT